jgi:peptidylprolyl isomerase
MATMTRRAALLALVASTAVAQAQNAPADPQNTLVLETTKGRILIALRTDLAPKHAERLKMLAREGYYNNVPFHRVIPGFMAQTGDGTRGDGTGGSKYPNLKAEFSKERFTRGVVGMARSMNPDSANSQFYIVYADAPHLNNDYTVVGRVISGMDVADKLKPGEPVRDPDRITKMTVQSDGR